MSFKSELIEKQNSMNAIIMDFLPKEGTYQKSILESMNYSVSVGGKRIRPILMNETYRMFGGKDSIVNPFLAAIEMIHSYSLVHDDLPAMDNDDFRRGQLTTHKKYGEALGILAGDALLNYAFELMSKACLENQESILSSVKAMHFLSEKAGIYGMIGGQVVDIESENKEISLEQLIFIHEHKTSALLEAAMVVGAILAGANTEEIEKISKIGKKIGLAFQIQDDILDVTSSTKVLGKPVNSDEKNNKSTYIKFLGMDQSKEQVEILSKEAINELIDLNGDSEFLIKIIQYLINRKK
ncbi:geranylgeranyl diphosphate synthase type II [Natranaerovirga pectinivora]|uniref:Farnesyl diphosphate synthase n=1 Tax=Natranaerovirga pectinivora TaxID=682400 RepID=A0A4R3MQW9_9FIRM|nr:farnesyl diphosphate synthase [Natranaerovirga pectinivora]TCT16923.1 geranylgeranyl diphosphate synthase type II [Natranaerovirga pectinivora]